MSSVGNDIGVGDLSGAGVGDNGGEPGQVFVGSTGEDIELCPFKIIIDSRENTPWSFEDIRNSKSRGRRKIVVPVETNHLKSGDYSIGGLEDQVAIERKSKADLFGTLGGGRERFVRELERLNAMKWACVIVESEWSGVLLEPPTHSNLPPYSVYQSVKAFQQRYPNVHWSFMPHRRMAMLDCFWSLWRFWSDLEEGKKG
jgi:hypothetical protein